MGEGGTSVSAIVPTLNEAGVIGQLVRALIAAKFDEVIVADGGSIDGTVEEALSNDALLARASPGRGAQMHAGAGRASGEALFFLHADSQLPNGARAFIAEALAEPSVVAGSFSLAFDHAHWFLQALSSLSAINHELTTYGDQGLFVRRAIYQHIGGFAPMPILEDLEIQRRLRQRGRFVKLRPAIVTSSRRYLRDGVLRRQALNTWLVLRYLAGADPEALARAYRPWRQAGSNRPPAPL